VNFTILSHLKDLTKSCNLAGTKTVLVNRLIKGERRKNDYHLQIEKIQKFLQPTQLSINNRKQLIIQHYQHNFNSVDRFNKYCGLISFPTRIKDRAWRFLIAIVEIATANAWALTADWKAGISDEEEVQSLKKFAQKLTDDLTSSV
jgi:hypothetical protein